MIHIPKTWGAHSHFNIGGQNVKWSIFCLMTEMPTLRALLLSLNIGVISKMVMSVFVYSVQYAYDVVWCFPINDRNSFHVITYCSTL